VKRVLFIAYFFPPLGGAGVQRSVKFVRYLPLFGYEPVVVTGPVTLAGLSPADPTFESELPADLDVRRVSGPEPEAGTRWRARGERWLRLSSAWSRWWVEAARTAGREAGGVDVVYASMSPWGSGDAAARLAEEFGRPWVADLRDPWALDEGFLYPTGLHRRLELSRMEELLASAAAIIMNTPEAALQLRRRFPRLADKRILAVPNGFDAADFAGPVPPGDPARFRIVHAGHVHTEVARASRKAWLARRLLGGMLGPIDFLTRSHLYLLRAVDRLLADQPGLSAELEVHLAGVLPESDRETLPGDVVRYHGYLPHADAVSLMRSADLLFLPLHDLPPGTRARIVPGKTYEYLASGRPILAALPDGDARDLLSEAHGTFLSRPADVDAMVEILRRRLDAFRRREPVPEREPSLLHRYERRTLTRQLAAVFDDVLGLQATDASPAAVSE
jgi:glycosyltransferase involved in cell wall biosynthesis